jgi:hypothetical protein
VAVHLGGGDALVDAVAELAVGGVEEAVDGGLMVLQR